MMQQIAAGAIINALDYNGAGSCGCVESAIRDVFRNQYATLTAKFHLEDLVDTLCDSNNYIEIYREFSNSREFEYGFKHIDGVVWTKMEVSEQHNYRLEMLYYFWMANQEM